MVTTIQVSETTKQLLDMYKKQTKESSYDNVLNKIFSDKLKIPKTMFGAAKGMKWNKSDRGEDREL